MRLLVVEHVASLHAWQMHSWGTSVIRTDNVDDGISMLRHEAYDLVLVDTTSLSEDGFAFIRRIRSAKNDTPLVALTGSKCDDRVRALRLGADDAVAQPIDPDELRARILAVIRRHKGHSQSLLRVGDLSLSIETREVCVSGRPLRLTGREYSMLELLVLRKGQIITKDMFLNHIYGGVDEPETKIIDVFICKLRRKLIAAEAGILVATVWGQGYALRDVDERQRQAGYENSCSGELYPDGLTTVSQLASLVTREDYSQPDA
jgi:two-component system, cell cycle response regulator CtrA